MKFQPGNKGGTGRKGPNKATVELRQLFDEVVADPTYQAKLRRDVAARRVHPAIESLIWAYHAGKPATQLDITASIDVRHRFEVEAQLLRGMNLSELEALAAESQAMLDRAIERMQAHKALQGKADAESPANLGGSDNAHFVNKSDGPETNGGSTDE